MTDFDILKKIIEARRTVKTGHFNGKSIDNSVVEQLIQLADWAPTHGHTEPWRFIIMHGRAVQRFCHDHAELYKNNTPEASFAQATYDKLYSKGDKTSQIIAVFSKRGEKQKITVQEEICATACAVQNLLLGAKALGVAAMWSTGGMVLKPAMKKYLYLREEDTMIGTLYLGYTDDATPDGVRITSLEEKVMWYRS